jgi:hypothetical protein
MLLRLRPISGIASREKSRTNKDSFPKTSESKFIQGVELSGVRALIFVNVGAEAAAEKVSYFVIPNEVRNLSGF